jgi:prepilin-type N-terminal cleavage/methylation domain-containing protein
MKIMRRNAAFTLVEIMIVVMIIALLAVIALPSFLRARQQAQNAKFINALRIATGAFEMYNMEHSAYPPDVNRGVVPPGMALYFGPTMQWNRPTPIGGEWDWDYNQFGFTAGVSVVGSAASIEQLTEIDQRIDDGDLSTGRFQDTASTRFTDIIQ